MNSALLKVWRRSCLPLATLVVQRRTRRTTGRWSQWMWATEGWHRAKPGSPSVQTSETSSGTRRRRFPRNCCAAMNNAKPSMIKAVGGLTPNNESRTRRPASPAPRTSPTPHSSRRPPPRRPPWSVPPSARPAPCPTSSPSCSSNCSAASTVLALIPNFEAK